MSKNTIVIADDHPLFRGALRETLAVYLEDTEIVEVSCFGDLIERLADRHTIDLVLFDLHLPDIPSILGVCYLRALHPELPVVIVSAVEDHETIQKCASIGVSGYIAKSSSSAAIRIGVETALSGGVCFPEDFASDESSEISNIAMRFTALTPRQLQVAMALAEGKLNKQIAFEIGTSEATVKAHVSAVIQKLNVQSRTQIVIAIGKIESGTHPIIDGTALLTASKGNRTVAIHK